MLAGEPSDEEMQRALLTGHVVSRVETTGRRPYGDSNHGSRRARGVLQSFFAISLVTELMRQGLEEHKPWNP